GKKEGIEKQRYEEQGERNLPAIGRGEAEKERKGKKERERGDAGIGGLGLDREAIDEPARGENAGAHPKPHRQCIPDRHLLERHPLLAHHEQRCKIAETVGDEIGCTACERRKRQYRIAEKR